MAYNYQIVVNGRSVEVSKPNATILVYKIPYRDLLLKNIGFSIKNKFVVYILFGRNHYGKDHVYVGKSCNGIANRPTSHEDRFDRWETCFILTQFEERTLFNDGTIQYLENRINECINSGTLYSNTTKSTSGGTANANNVIFCDEYLEQAIQILYVLGFDLLKPYEEITVVDEEEITRDEGIPDGDYYIQRKIRAWDNKTPNATMRVQNGEFIVQSGSEICPVEGTGVMESILRFRRSDLVKDGTLVENLRFTSPSSAAEFVLGHSSNGWIDWRTQDGIPLQSFRAEK